MGEKDIAEKILLAYNDVFSDIVNVLLFGGQESIRENDLEDQIYNEELKEEGGVKTMCDVLDRAIEKGKIAGIQEGRSDGIRNMIELCQDFGTTEADAQSQIIMRFHMQEDEAIKYIKTFWRSEKK